MKKFKKLAKNKAIRTSLRMTEKRLFTGKSRIYTARNLWKKQEEKNGDGICRFFFQ